jgi:hypothetical protein
MVSVRLALVPSLLITLHASLAAAQAPVVQAGECLYLYGAPPGEPAAATEEFRSGTQIYEECTQTTTAEVGRDEAHRLTVEMSNPGGPNRECLAMAWSEHQFVVEADAPVRVIASASGHWTGLLVSVSDSWSVPTEAWLVLSAVEIRPGGSERRVDESRVARHVIDASQLSVADPWSRSLQFDALPGQRLAVRLELWLRGQARMRTLDFGTPGTGRGASYDTIDVCVLPSSASMGSDDDDLERDLYEKRCLPSVWMPESAEGRLEDAAVLVASLVARAGSTGDPGANVALARQRQARAATEMARGQYQRACRSLSDAVRALTTP